MSLNTGLNIRGVGSLPLPVKMVMGLVAGGSIMGAAYYFSGGNKMIVFIVAGGLIFVMIMLWLFKAILGWARKRKSNPLSQGISGNAAAAPQGISEPARRARLDDLRRNFEQGVEKFRAAGKNLYSVPWYALVGEPGSGKTEAIRHCNVGFPGLQDQLQGAGGTLNMNWWFTNQAIILDTAGRLMFEEVAPGSTNEWNEFLKLLKTNRPNCPINGMLLVIPVDTLIKDTADSIEKKAGKIAQQLDQIQRILGVRFPVFIIITKCDLLNGFREFFDDLNDPQLQHQIMGWSNPAPLDEKFNPSVVITHLETVKKRLIERRQQLLLDPVNTEDPQGRRVDQVDALYALPDSIANIGPRLRRYLEMIFQAGEWSPQPLFLRGIYFTSSMTEGSALDAELAQVLGVPLDSLPEGRVWRRDRAYFLRDLFIEKVFREKGLVTRASNADKQQRTRRAVVLTVGFLAVAILFTFTWLGARQLEEHIGKHRDFWVAANDSIDPASALIINPKNNDYYTQPFKVGDKQTTIAKFFGQNLDLLKAKIEVPLLFRPMAIIGGNIDTTRRSTYRVLYESTILRPIYAAARKRIGDDKFTFVDWTDDSTGSLVQLMKLEYANATKTHAPGPHPEVEIDPLFHLVLSPADYEIFKGKDAADLQDAADWIYSPEADGTSAWPPALLQPGTADSLKVIDDGVDKTLSFWLNQSNLSPRMDKILAVQTALDKFGKAETILLALKHSNIDKLDTYNGFLDTWNEQFKNITTARTEALTAWNALIKDSPEHSTLALKDFYSAEMERIGGDRKKVYDTLLALTVEAPSDPAKATDSARTLAQERAKIQNAISSLNDWKSSPESKKVLDDLADLDTKYLGTIKDGETTLHRFEVAAKFYETADSFLIKKDDEKNIVLTGSMNDALSKIDSDVNAADGAISKPLLQTSAPDDQLAQAGGFTKYAVDIGAACHRYLLAQSAMSAMLKNNTNDAWAAYIANLAKSQPPEHMVRPPVPFINNADKNFPAQWSPDAVGFVFESMTAIDALAASKDPKILDVVVITTNSATIRKYLDGYLAAYRTYWETGVFAELRFNTNSWKEFSDALPATRESTIRGALNNYADKVIYALKKVNDAPGVTNVQAALALGEGESFKKDGVDLIAHWRDFSDDYHLTRSRILAMDPGSFLETYTSGTAKISDGFVGRYWQGLPLEAVRVLGVDGQKDIIAGLKELAQYERFPLAPPKADAHDDLTAAEVVSARAAMEKVKGTDPNALKGGSKSIGDGSLTRDKDMDSQLDALRGGDSLRGKQEYLNSVDAFLKILPRDATKPFTVTMTVLKDTDKLNAENSISRKYTYLMIYQGKVEPLHEAYLSGANADTADIQYPSADMVFNFKETPTGEAKGTETFSGPWAVFRLIKAASVQGKTVTHVGPKWTVEYGIKDANGKTWSLWLQFDFNAAIPDVADWPVPPSAVIH